jgi:hypothetical protein
MDSQSSQESEELLESEELPESHIPTESEAESDFEQPHTPRQNQLATSRDTRIAIKTALLFKVPWAQIRDVLGVTFNQIAYGIVTEQLPKSTSVVIAL